MRQVIGIGIRVGIGVGFELVFVLVSIWYSCWYCIGIRMYWYSYCIAGLVNLFQYQ